MIGILALQGDFQAHARYVEAHGAKSLLVTKHEQLKSLHGLVIPGGESTTFLKLLDEEFLAALRSAIGDGLPTLGTCAGLILLAKRVSNPEQSCLGLLDVCVKRNAYGRQLDSFVEPSLNLTETGKKIAAAKLPADKKKLIEQTHEAVFIRAPKIESAGADVSVLAEHQKHPVFVNQENIFATTFHPELSPAPSIFYQIFLSNKQCA